MRLTIFQKHIFHGVKYMMSQQFIPLDDTCKLYLNLVTTLRRNALSRYVLGRHNYNNGEFALRQLYIPVERIVLMYKIWSGYL